MNDRYLFRAKRIDNGKWTICNLIDSPDGKNAIAETSAGWLIYDVDTSTICQFTGLKDKNGNPIFENDICIIRNGVINEEDGYFRIDWESDQAMFELEGTGLCANFDNIYGHECEVVGNIFDNPELLEQEEEEWTD